VTDPALDVVAVLIARPGHEAALADILAACVAPSRAETGCLTYRLHRDRGRPGRFVFIERWADAAAFAAHQATPHFQALVAAVGDHVETPPEVMVVEAII